MHSHIEFETPVMRVCLRLVREEGGIEIIVIRGPWSSWVDS